VAALSGIVFQSSGRTSILGAVQEGPGSLEALRQLNRLRVLESLRRRGGASRADIVRETGLSRTTVSSLVAALIDEGLVVERSDRKQEAPSPNGGRPPTLLTLDPTAGGVIGIDFGHDDVRVAVADLSCSLLAETGTTLDVDHQADEAISAAAEMALGLLEDLGLDRERIIGIGVAVSAPVRAGSRTVASPAIFPGWIDVDVGDELNRRLHLPVFLGNDANLGALAEATFGAGRGVDNLIYVMLSAGVGAGLVLNGRLYEGDTGIAGELGHVVVQPEGLVCRCGNRGCLETVAGASALVDALRHSHGPEITLDGVLRLAHGGDAGARRVLADAGRAVGRALAGICSVLDPRLVVAGGDVAAAGDVLLDGIRESIERTMTPSAGHAVTVVGGELAARAEVLGAIALAMSSTSSHVPSRSLTGLSA
jgi:predicted NBD/HSP70 family sugar kinase